MWASTCTRSPCSPFYAGTIAIRSSRAFSSPFAAAATMSAGGGGNSSGLASGRTFEYGRTHVVKPKGRHLATIVWLHGLGDQGASWSQVLESLNMPNIKFICPTAPMRPLTVFGGFPSTAWFDVADLSEESLVDLEGLDATAAHVANLLSAEPPDVKLGIGGFSMGAATALYSATCYACGKYKNGNPYPVKLSAVVALSGWLPSANTLKSRLESSSDAAARASALPVLICHGERDEVVMYKFGTKSADALTEHGFSKVLFKSYERLQHHTKPEELDFVCEWLTSALELRGAAS